MTYRLQSPAGEIATFQQITQDLMAFGDGRDNVELTVPNARKVWQALRLCQWQPIDGDALLIWQGLA